MTQKVMRKKVFVNRDIQGTILGRLAKYWVMYHLGLWCLLFVVDSVWRCITAFCGGHRPVDLGEFCAGFARDHWAVLTMPILLFPAILWEMLHLTHQIAGPLVRFRSALRQLAAGQSVERIELREGDLLAEFQKDFNAFLDSDRLRNDPSSKPRTTAESDSPEDAILDDVTALIAASLQAECRPSAAAVP